jgi:AraC-like DNA-binding protein
MTGLSVSRFLHLFGRELGVPFRRFRAWKRARSLLAFMATRQNLAEFALRVGYPDSTHFSHSIRTVYGMCPREIFAHGKSISVRVI